MVSTTSTVGVQTVSGSSSTAMFVDNMQQGTGCNRTDSGACSLYSCSGGTFTLPSAGTITVSGGTQAVSLATRGDGSYIAYGNSTNVVFPQGQKLWRAHRGNGGTLVPGEHVQVTAVEGLELTVE